MNGEGVGGPGVFTRKYIFGIAGDCKEWQIETRPQMSADCADQMRTWTTLKVSQLIPRRSRQKSEAAVSRILVPAWEWHVEAERAEGFSNLNNALLAPSA
jgi:hypothetical protein